MPLLHRDLLHAHRPLFGAHEAHDVLKKHNAVGFVDRERLNSKARRLRLLSELLPLVDKTRVTPRTREHPILKHTRIRRIEPLNHGKRVPRFEQRAEIGDGLVQRSGHDLGIRLSKNGETANSITPVFDHHQASVRQRVQRRLQNVAKSGDDLVGARVTKTKNHNADFAAPKACNDLSEIEIKSENDSSLGSGFRKDLVVRHALERLLSKVNRVVSFVAQPLNDTGAHAHVTEKLQPAAFDGWTSSVVSQAAY